MVADTEPNNPYALNSTYGSHPAVVPANPPAVRMWALIYNICMVALYILVAGLGLVLIIFADEINSLEEGQDMSAMIGGVIYTVLGIVLAIVFAVGIVWRRGNGAWIYQTVLIAIGLSSCITWPATIPLLIYWIRDKKRLLET